MRSLNIDYQRSGAPAIVIGTGGIGGGMFFAMDGNETLGRNESRGGKFLDTQDYCKLHIIAHYIAVLLGAGEACKVFPLGKVGQDDVGRHMVNMMAETGMDVSHIQEMDDVNTLMSVCFLYPDSSGGNLTTSDSASSHVNIDDVEAIRPMFEQYKDRGVVLAAPEVPLDARLRLLELGKEHGFYCCASITSGEAADALSGNIGAVTDLLSVNHEEAAAIAGLDVEKAERGTMLDACAVTLTARNSAIRIAVTAGSEGVYGYADNYWTFVPGVPVTPVNTAGAGDAFMAGLIVGHVAGLPFSTAESIQRKSLSDAPISTALELSSVLASMTVTDNNTIHTGVDAVSLYAHIRQWNLELADPVQQLFE